MMSPTIRTIGEARLELLDCNSKYVPVVKSADRIKERITIVKATRGLSLCIIDVMLIVPHRKKKVKNYIMENQIWNTILIS